GERNEMTLPVDPVSRFLIEADARPAHAAVVESGRTVTYAMMADRVRRLAYSISEIGPHPRVLIHLPAGSGAYAGMLATLMAGGYYATTNLQTPSARQRSVCQLFDPEVVISDSESLYSLAGAINDRPLVRVDGIGSDVLTSVRQPDALAYVMFTSGTTGVAKGVMIGRSALSHYVAWSKDAMAVQPEDRWSQHPNIAFDLSILDIYGALCSGATLYPLISRGDRLMPAEFIRRHGLTIWNSVPSVIDLMQRRSLTPDHFASLRLATFCGEPLRREHLDVVFSMNPRVLVHNTYGPTETTVSCTLLQLTAESYASICSASVPLGDAIQDMQLFLVGGSSPEE